MKRILLLSIPGLLAILFYLDLHPILLPPHSTEGSAIHPPASEGHPILLLYARDHYGEASPDHPDDRWPDLEWINILQQYFGGCDVRDIAEMNTDAELLENRNLVVLPHRSLSSLDTLAIERMAEHVRKGTSILFEAPDPTWARLLGLEKRKTETLKSLPWPFLRASSRMDAPLFLPPPPPIRLRVDLPRYLPVPSTSPMSAGLRAAGRTMAWHRREGDGLWIVLSLDLGRLSLNLRQGIPDENFRLPDRHPDRLSGPGETNDLVATADLLQSDHPWLDAWIHALLDPDLQLAPWPRLWCAPAAQDGWMLLTHDDEGFGDLSRWITHAQAEVSIPSTLFLWPPRASLSREGMAEILSDPVEAGLHPRWPVRFTLSDPYAPRTLIGFWKIQPFVRLPGLIEQRDALQAMLPEGRTLNFSRNHFLLWPEDVDDAWKQLTGAGFRGDSSYGPDWDCAGWLFGSTMPFQPLSREGLIYPLHEIPYQAAEIIGDMSPQRLSRWMATNATGAQGPIHLLFHPDAYGWIPSADLFRYWDSIPELVSRHQHQAATLAQLLDFWESRSAARIHWTVEAGVLRIHFQNPQPVEGFPLGVAIPRRWDQQLLKSWKASWPVVHSRSARSFQRDVRVFELPAGEGEIEFIYSLN